MDRTRYLDTVTDAIKRAADILKADNDEYASRARSPQPGPVEEQRCFQCGTSDNRYDECNGCRAARRMESRQDMGRE